MQDDPLISFLRDGGREAFAASDLTVYAERPSDIAPNGMVKFVVGIRCPRCDHTNSPMHHGSKQKCGKCGLNMQLYGNSLECW